MANLINRIESWDASMARVAGFVLIFLGLTVISSSAFAEVSVEPTRIILTKKQHTQTVTVRNDGSRSVSVGLVWTKMVQAADASLHPTGVERGVRQARLIRVTPTTAELYPGQQAVFTLQLDPNTPDEIEIREHLRFDIDQTIKKGPRWAVVIPVFIRLSIAPPKVSITGVHNGQNGEVHVSMIHASGASPYGHLSVFDHQSEIARLNNVNLYRQDQTTSFSVPVPAGTNGNLTVQYIGDAEFSGQLLAEQSGQINSGPSQ